MRKSDYSNLRFDEKSIFTPEMISGHLKKSRDFLFSKYVILGYFPSLYTHIKNNYSGMTTGYINKLFPYYSFKYNNQLITFQFPGIGAPLSGALLEESISLGGETFIFFGRAGLLNDKISRENLIIPTAALIDEGTSAHYIESDIYSYPDKKLVNLIDRTLESYGHPVQKGKIWTTDGVYRETPSKIKRAVKNGCIAVDMEASALFTIAKFHNKRIAGFFVPSDYLSLTEWGKIKSDNVIIKPVLMLQLALDIIDKFRKGKDAA